MLSILAAVSVINPVKKIKIKILGTSAGGGLPQWNCNCNNCQLARNSKIPHRTQSSIAINNNNNWSLINASPDIRNQINDHLVCKLCDAPIRDNRIKNIVLVDSQLDHTLGLLNIREGDPLDIYCTDVVKKQITDEFPIIRILDSYCGTNINSITIGTSFSPLENVDIFPVNIESNSPPYSEHRGSIVDGSNIGLIITNTLTGQKLFYAPGLGKITPEIENIFSAVDYILIDGTCWTDDELLSLKICGNTASFMGHISQSSSENGESLIDILRRYPKLKKALIHINNTNPILHSGPESEFLKKENISIAYDGMEIYI